MKGEVVSLQTFDVGGTLDLRHLERALAHRLPQRAPGIGKGTPAYVEFPQPLVLVMPDMKLETPVGERTAKVTVAFFPIGVISVRIRTPVESERLAPFQTWGQTVALLDGKRLSLESAGRALVEADRALWTESVRDRYTTNVLSESYTVFAFSDVGEPTSEFLRAHEAEIAALLKGEDGTRLHEKEVKEALRKWFSYYSDDLTVIDWDAALIIDPSPEYEDLVFVLEIANIQLLEFRSYDDHLDDVIARGYDELTRLYRRRGLFRNARKTAHELSLLRIEVAELADEADNITKFLGDWFLARVYEAAQEKFHLAAWRQTVDEKLGVLFNLYQIANAESDNLRLLTLEVLIVLLFVLDLAVILVL